MLRCAARAGVRHRDVSPLASLKLGCSVTSSLGIFSPPSTSALCRPCKFPGYTNCLRVDTAWPLFRDCCALEQSSKHQVRVTPDTLACRLPCSAPTCQLLYDSRGVKSLLCFSNTAGASSSRASRAGPHAADTNSTGAVAP